MGLKIQNPSSVDLNKVVYDKLYKTTNGLTKSTITYLEATQITESSKPKNAKLGSHNLVIKGPKMTLGSDVVKVGSNYYVDLLFNNKSLKNRELLNLIKDLDHLTISDIFGRPEAWYEMMESPVSLCQIETEYVPTIKLSTMHVDQESLKLCDSDIEFFDQDHLVVPHLLLKQGYSVVPLLELSSVYKDERHIWVEWKLLQLKADLPPQLFQKCQLVDINDSEDEEIEAVADDNFY